MGSIGTIMFALSLQSDSLSNRTCDSLWTWQSCFWSGGLGSWQDIAVNARLGLVCILSGLCCSVEWKERRGRERRGEEEKGEKSGDFFERCNTNLLVKDVNCIQKYSIRPWDKVRKRTVTLTGPCSRPMAVLHMSVTPQRSMRQPSVRMFVSSGTLEI